MALTNAEKFKEVFGFEPHGCPLPPAVCKASNASCNKCPFDDFWEKEYKECFQLDMEKVKELLNKDG